MNEEIDIYNELIKNVKYTWKSYFSGDLKPWFEQLSNDSIYIGSGEPLLIGKKAIINHFKNYKNMKTNIINEDYHVIIQGKTLGIVYGQIIVLIPDSLENTIIRFTIMYRIKKNKYEIVHHHNTYEYHHNTTINDNSSILVDDMNLQLIRNLFLHQDNNIKITIPSRNNTFYLNSNMILYIESFGKKTEVVCADCIISCNYSISEMKSILPNVFYPIHRSYLVNTNHIFQIKRFEVKMINGNTIPIPALNYTKVKKDLEKHL